MEEESKYYTPEIKEFHVGFEYEFRSLKGWETRTFNSNDGGYFNSVSETKEYISEGIIRVKYLDRKDIESLGWKFKRNYEKLYYYEIGNIWEDDNRGGFLDYNVDTKILKIITTDKGYNQDGPNHSVKFKGIIKNKSELKKLMKMLDIENNKG